MESPPVYSGRWFSPNFHICEYIGGFNVAKVFGYIQKVIRGLVDIYSTESEGMMNKSSQQRTATGIRYMPQETERGELSIITEKRFIRRICLNNKIIPMEVDLSSLVSVITGNRLENRGDGL